MPASADRRAVLQGALTVAALGPMGTAGNAAAPNPLLQPGISLALARRRAAQIGQVRYDIALDLTDADRATGTIAITFERRAGSGDLVLDFRGPRLVELVANGRPVPSPNRVHGHLVLPQARLRTGANRLVARFETPIAAADAAIIRFRDPKDGQIFKNKNR